MDRPFQLTRHVAVAMKAAEAVRHGVVMPENGRGVGREKSLGHDAIALKLGSEIISGVHAPGSRMPLPPEFSERFGASRVVMREVYKTLAAKGMLSAKTKVGTVVLPLQHWNWFDPQLLAWRVEAGLDDAFLLQLTEMRLAVEPAASALAALRRTSEQLALLKTAVAGMRHAGADRHRYVQSDVLFHEAICEASGNPLFGSFARVVEVALHALFSLSTAPDSQARQANVEDHALIAEAIERGDEQGAARATRRVIDDGMLRLLGRA